MILWAALGFAFYGAATLRQTAHHPKWASSGILFLALVGACALPYLLGFAYIRHVSILIYPSVLMCCAVLIDNPEPIS